MQSADELTFVQWLARAAHEFADDLAIIDAQPGGRELTFGELYSFARDAAAALCGLGVEPGEAVAIWAPNSWEWVVAALAVAAAGGRIAPVNTRFRGAEVGGVLRRSRAQLLFTVDRFLTDDYAAILGDAGALPDLRHVVLLRGEPVAGWLAWDEFLGHARSADQAAVARRSAAITPDDIALILFTSGTTGMPKGALIRGGALSRTFSRWTEYMGVRRGDRILAINPFFHSLGLNTAILAGLISGATIVIYAVWDAGSALDWVELHRITVFPGPPAVFQGLLNQSDLDARDLSSLRSAVTGAADIPESLVTEMFSKLGFETVITGYGLTESSGVVSLSRPGDDAHTVATTDGRLLPGVEVKIVDDTGGEVGRGEAGEVLVRGYVVMEGYLDDPEATAATITGDGWLVTGDIGTLAENDYLTITGRKKDMYIVGGFNAYPADIEGVLAGHGDVGEIAVVGVPDERLGEVGAAFVVPAPGRELDPAAVIAWARERMANYKVPRHVWAVDSLPLNSSNKVAKLELTAEALRRLGVS